MEEKIGWIARRIRKKIKRTNAEEGKMKYHVVRRFRLILPALYARRLNLSHATTGIPSGMFLGTAA